ncbi:hypothetical protein ACN27B_03040 [Micromonospora sp. WMMD754]|uniref:hypothetical protein n=1 Tax=Micromonospora TaxID=1873 RepID=UPI0037AC3600
MAGQELPLADALALGELAYLRRRSLRNPRYRDAAYVRLYVTPRYLRWSRPSALDAHLEQVRHHLAAVERLTRRQDPGADAAWQAALAAVDALLAEGGRLAGHRIRPRRI